MALRLRYKGTLPPCGNHDSRKEDKHRIRLYFHDQLKRYMDDPSLQAFLLSTSGERKRIGNWQFQPIICTRPPFHCELEIRISTPRLDVSLVENQGDLDSRLKTLFDALRAPRMVQEIPPDREPASPDDLYYVLLENDSLVTDLIIRTELDFSRTIEPRHPQEAPEVELDIFVRVRDPLDIIVS